MKPQKGADKTAEKTSTIKVGKDSGRVKVFVRVRPPRPQENSRKEPTAVNALELSSQIHVLDPKHSWEKTFNFDHVFPQESTNPEVCSTISRPLVNAALNGFNGTLMAYGQTGSGKTHTLMAPDGITAGVIERCFKRITMDDRHDYKVTMSYLQIYQEKIYDLLNSTNKVELSLREHPVKGVYVENLSEYVVRSPSEVLNLLAVGKKRLIFAETKMNRTSSRSHSVCQLRIERTLNKSKAPSEGSGKDGVTKQGVHPKDSPAGCSKKSQGLPGESADTVTGSKEDLNEEDGSVVKMVAFDDDVLIRGRIYLCDLAGSERLKKTQAEGERLSEAQHINSSLLELGNVIQALADGKKTHVPFRNSTLTRLLQESLGGNCKTSLVVCVSPTASDVSETKSALFFGSRAMKITNTAYVNVEVDYQRLSEDLSKIVDMREKDLVELRHSYETRIERMKHEAETTVTNSMAEAEKLVASVKSLYENQQSSLQNDLENLQTSLEEEKARAENHHREITDVRCKLKKDMHRSRTVLLMDIVSMQLLCAIKKLSLQDGSSLPTCKTDIKANGNHCTAARSKILENTDVLLKLFKSYLRLMNSKGNELLENGATLRCMVELCDEKTVLCDTNDVLCDADEVSLYLANKTDDDKVVASSLVESRDDCVPPGGEVLFEDDEYSKLRDRLASLKESIDDEALEFLSKAFELDQEGKDQTLESRQDIYNMIKEFMERRSSFSDTSGSSEVSSLADAVTLLDHCHSHVLVDKALQSALLLLENTSITRRCREVSMQKGAVEKENEALKSQVQSLQSEAENLNGKLTETSTKLCDVKKSKQQLEDDLSSVFQLHNMRDNGREEATENGGESQLDGVHDIPAKLHAEISTLVENNVKLIEELAATEKEKENLESQLTCTKAELEEEKAKFRVLAADRHCQSTQTEETEEEEDSIESQDQDLLARFLSVLNDDYSALEKAAYAAQTNAIGDVSSLRTVINQRLGEEWSLMVLENAKMKSELVNIRGRIEEEKESFESQLTNLEMEELSQGERHNVERNGCREEDVESFPKFEKSFASEEGDTKTFDIMIYDQNKVIAKLEMDKLELVKGLQRFKQDSENRRKMSSGGGNDCNTDDKIVGDSQATDSSLEEENGLGDILKEKLQELLKFQQENQSINDELVALRSKYNSLEKDNHDSNKSRERLEQRLERLVEGEKHLSSNILEMRDGYAKMEEKLAQASTEKSELREELKELEQKTNEAEQERDAIKHHKTVLEEKLAQVSKEKSEIREQLKEMERKANEAEQERDAIKHHKTVLEEILLEDAKRAERVLASEKGQRSVCEEGLREKAKELEIARTLLKLNENRISKMDKDLSETKKSCELLQESVNELEGERENLIKEINSLRCLQGLPTVNLKPISSKGLPQKQTASKGAPKRQQNKQGNKLNSELTRAKEQLVRLKAELTLSNMQTRNLGSQLSSLREDSTKLEAELSTVRVSPTRLRPRRNSFSCYDETVRLEMELAEAKGKIIELQEKLLSIYKEKFVLEEKLLSCDLQVNKEKEVAVTGQIDDKENEIKDEKMTLESCAGDEAEKPLEAQRAITHEQQEFDSEQKKNLEKKINLLEEERTQLKKELESTNVDKCRLEGIECCIQQLVTLEDDKLRLQRKLKHWAQGGPEDKDLNTASEKQEQSKKVENTVSLKKAASKTFKSDLLAEIKDLSTENYALQEEAESLKEKVIELEGALTALKFKVSVQDTVQDATADKKALATLLASVKQERNGLQQAVQELLGEKDDVEEELAGIKAKYSNVQRELAMTSMMKDDLEVELMALKNANLTRGFSSQTQSSDDCRSELSDSSFDDMVFFSGGGQLLSPEPLSTGNTLLVPPQEHKPVVTRNGKKPVNGSTTRKATTARNQRDGNVSSSSNGSLSSSSGINQIEKKAPLPKQRNSARSQTTGSKASGRRILPSEPRSERLGKAFPRFNTDDNQSPTDNTQQSAISFDLIRIDDVTDDTPNADSDCTDSGLFRETPEGERENPETPAGERENPEGMEDEEMDDKTLIPLHETTNGDKEDKTVITSEKTVDLEKHLVPVLTISELGSEFQVDEVLVKTTWSLKNLFRRQKSLPLPDIGVGALKQ